MAKQPTTKPAPQAQPTVTPAAANAIAAMANALATIPPTAPRNAGLGHAAVTHVKLGAKQYRCKKQHTAQRWQLLVQAAQAGNGTIALQPLLAQCLPGWQAHNYAGPGVPSHFVTYCLAHGYLVPVASGNAAAVPAPAQGA